MGATLTPRLLKNTLLAAIITAVVGASMISDALTDTDKMNTIRDLRRASAILALGESSGLRRAMYNADRQLSLSSPSLPFS